MDEDLSQRVETLEKQVVQRFLIEGTHDPEVCREIRLYVIPVSSLEDARVKVREMNESFEDIDFDKVYSEPEPGYTVLTVYSDGSSRTDPV